MSTDKLDTNKANPTMLEELLSTSGENLTNTTSDAAHGHTQDQKKGPWAGYSVPLGLGGLAAIGSAIALYNYSQRPRERVEQMPFEYVPPELNKSDQDYINFLKESQYLRPSVYAYAVKLSADADSSSTSTSTDDSSDNTTSSAPDTTPSDGDVAKKMLGKLIPQNAGTYAKILAGLGGIYAAQLAWNTLGGTGRWFGDKFDALDDSTEYLQRFGDVDKLDSMVKDFPDIGEPGSLARSKFLRDTGRKNLDELLELKSRGKFLEPEDIALMRTLADAKKANPEYYRQLGKTFKERKVPVMGKDYEAEINKKSLEYEANIKKKSLEYETAMDSIRKQLESSKSEYDRQLSDRDKLIKSLQADATTRSLMTTSDRLKDTWHNMSPYEKATVAAVPTLATAYGGYRIMSNRKKSRRR